MYAIMFRPNYGPTEENEKIQAWNRGKGKMVSLFSTTIEQLTLFRPQSSVGSAAGSARRSGRKVFVVHGHDEGLKETVQNLLNKLGLEPIILHKLPNKGRTIIEKFEEHSDVSFERLSLNPTEVIEGNTYA